MSIQRTLDVLVTLNTIQLRHQPMAFDPVMPVKAFVNIGGARLRLIASLLRGTS